jgi:HK97 family phage major capsid protein
MITSAEADPTEELRLLMQQVGVGFTDIRTRLEHLEIARQRIPTMALDGRSLERNGFENLGEFIATTRFAPHDNRLAVLAPTGERALSMGTGAAGGFLVPPQFSAELMDAVSTQSIVRPRARHVGTGGPTSDSEITVPVLDISGTKGVRSGVHCHWIGEAASKPDTEPSFGQVTLKPSECAAMVTCSDKLLRNAEAATGVISFLLTEAIRAEEDACFIAGDGVAKPLGFLGHACSIEVARAGAGTIVMADIENMLMAARAGRPYVWLGSRTILGQLMELTLTGGVGGTANPVWLPSAREGLPSTLMGLPLLEPEGAPTLGNLGDLCLCDFGFYLIRDGFGPEIRTSDAAGTNFATNQTSIKITFNVDGQPWLRTPIRRADGTDCSPFVVLN